MRAGARGTADAASFHGHDNNPMALFNQAMFDQATFDSPDGPPSPLKGKRMSKITFPVNRMTGTATQLAEYLDTLKADLTAKNRDPSQLITDLGAGAAATTAKDRLQEDAKLEWQRLTEELEPLKAALYKDISGGCDLIISVFGRGSLQAKEATRLRKQLTQSGGGEEEPPAPPPPAP